MRGTAADPEKDECVGQDHRRGIEAVLTVNRSKKASRLSFDFVFEKGSSFSNSFYRHRGFEIRRCLRIG